MNNFRSLRDAQIELNDLTGLIGPNGAGKSSFLRALDLFYEPNASYTEDDFYNRNVENEISVKVTFTDLGEEAREKFSPYISGDTLTVEKVMGFPDRQSNQKYYGNRPNNPDFDAFREAGGTDLRREYNELREGEYDEFPEYQNQDEAEEALRAWEEEHAEECVRRRDDGQFFGFNPVGQAALEEFTQFILIPAVREASEEAGEGRNSALDNLMDLVVRATLSERGDLEDLRETTQADYERIVSDAAEDELRQLEGDISTTLQTFAPGVDVDLSWDTEGAIDIQMPSAEIRLREDDFASSVDHAGHGSQRAFIISLLQNLTLQGEQEDEDGERPEPSLILGIEEPELYQHPNRQRHLMSILSSFEDQEVAGVASSVQVVYSTHSPLMVRMERFDDIRALRKASSTDGGPKVTEIRESSLDEVARELERIAGVDSGSFSPESTRARLEPVMTPWINEGFFSDVVVLVEGLEDRSALLGRARTRDIDLNSDGVAVLPCNGKTKLDRPAIIFSNLGKDVYLIFDSDYDKEHHIDTNHLLLRLVDADVEDWPDGVYPTHACFESTLADTLRTELGEDFFDEAVREACDTFGYRSTDRGMKNPAVMSQVFDKADEDGRECNRLDEIIDQVVSI